MNDLELNRALTDLEYLEDARRTLQERPPHTARTFRIKAYAAAKAREARLQALEVAKARYGAAA